MKSILLFVLLASTLLGRELWLVNSTQTRWLAIADASYSAGYYGMCPPQSQMMLTIPDGVAFAIEPKDQFMDPILPGVYVTFSGTADPQGVGLWTEQGDLWYPNLIDSESEVPRTKTLLMVLEFMGLGVAAFGVSYGSAFLLRLFDAAATLAEK